jgi:hypothetical protein
MCKLQIFRSETKLGLKPTTKQILPNAEGNEARCSKRIVSLFLNTVSVIHVSGVCVTDKTGFGFDDRIYWTFIQLITTVHRSVTLSSSDWTLQWNYFDFQLNCYCWLLVTWPRVGPEHMKHIRCPAMDICEPHRKHLFCCCIYNAVA